MAQGLRELTALTEGPGSVPSTHNRRRTNACDSSSRGLTPSAGAHGHLSASDTYKVTQTPTRLPTHTHTLKVTRAAPEP